MKRTILYIVGALLVLTLFFFWIVLWAPNSFEGDRFIKVSKGESFAAVVDSLASAGIIGSKFRFELAGRILDLTTKMQIGKYRFKSGMSNQEILKDLRAGKSIEMILVTIREGVRATRQAQILARAVGIDSAQFMKLVYDREFVSQLGIRGESLEGYLMPETYRVFWQSDEEDLIREMVDQFWKVFDSSMIARARLRGLSVKDVVTIASIIEGETRIDSERAIIAGVYYNRLKKRMPLQADPTIQYALGDQPRLLRYKDLKINSPYNTYLHPGLPPGPVNNPGKAAITAALYPKAHRYYFFVATGSGGHRFSRTFDEHRRAVRQYLKRREEQASTSRE